MACRRTWPVRGCGSSRWTPPKSRNRSPTPQLTKYQIPKSPTHQLTKSPNSVFGLPPLPAQVARARPDFLERLRLVEPAVLHHIPNGRDVGDVDRRVFVEHLQIGQLASFDRAQVLCEAQSLGTRPRRAAQDVDWRHAAAGD